jgi:hypothetical protein
MRPPGWPARVVDPDDADLTGSATRWLWDVGSVERSPVSVWGRHPRALAFRVRCDLEARIEGARLAYSQARAALAGTDVALEDVLAALEAEAAHLQRLRREVIMVEEALAGRRWQARL